MMCGSSILAFLLFWLPLWASADGRADAMNAVTARVLCLPTTGDPQTGSGIVIDGGSHLVTNWHLVACTQEGGEALVLLNADTRDKVAAVVRERDETQDLAILTLAQRLDRPGVRFATLATLRQGDPVMAVGFPSDADQMGGQAALSASTLTQGVVGRLLPAAPGQDRPLIQASAAINPGSSGGPLFDEAGRVVGIVTLKSLAAVAALNAAGDFAMQRVVQGEGLGWAVASDALLPLLVRAGIPYAVSQARLWALERWWQREPALMASLGMLLLLILGLTVLLVTATGRARVRESLTRLGSRGHPATTPSAPQRQAPMASRLPVLLGIAGPYAGQTIPLPAAAVAIGRDPALAQLVMPADQARISQRHALVGHDPDQGGFYVEDCWSTNGVFLLTGRGKAIRAPAGQAQPLAPGARFYLATPAVSFEVNYQ
ncbi:MAG: trypsin-like peptidase domain-containing protein [Chromatiaceae bacterium]